MPSNDLSDLRIARASAVLNAIRAEEGARWQLNDKMPGGQLGGAWRVRDGNVVAVLKWHEPDSDVPRNPEAAAVVAYARAAGYPTPAWLAHGTTEEGVAWSIQELVDGDRPLHLDVPAAERAVGLIELQRTIEPPTSLSWNAYMLEVVGGAPPAWRRFAEPHLGQPLPGHELVHADFGPANIIVRDGQVAGVIDMDAAGRGCAAYDLLAMVAEGLAWGGDADALALLQATARDAYDEASLTIAATCLVVEKLSWTAAAQGAERADELARVYEGWLESL